MLTTSCLSLRPTVLLSPQWRFPWRPSRPVPCLSPPTLTLPPKTKPECEYTTPSLHLLLRQFDSLFKFLMSLTECDRWRVNRRLGRCCLWSWILNEQLSHMHKMSLWVNVWLIQYFNKISFQVNVPVIIHHILLLWSRGNRGSRRLQNMMIWWWFLF